jgi:epoxyqueuosine reductase
MEAMTPTERAATVRRMALDAGFARAGVARAGPIVRASCLDSWLQAGFAGEMAYLARWRDLRVDPRRLLPGARSVIVVGYLGSAGEGACPPAAPAQPDRQSADDSRPRGRVARYAWGRDYHRVMRKMLRRFVAELHGLWREPFETRICVDTAPIMERELAAAAGLGWIGKNTMLIDAQLGSVLMLGEVITTLELEPSLPVPDRCGTCSRCLEACPTKALVAPHRLDASRCISYLTIEHRGEIPADLQACMGDWVFGCDRCQEVCPHNRRTAASLPPVPDASANPLTPRPVLADVLSLTQERYRDCLAGSPMKRATLEMLKRNAAIALTNLDANDEGGTTG